MGSRDPDKLILQGAFAGLCTTGQDDAVSRKRPGVLSHWGLQKPGGGNSHLEKSRADAINPLKGQVSTHLELTVR